MVVGLNAIKNFQEQQGLYQDKLINSKGNIENVQENKIVFPYYTMIGALAKYISTENTKFQPMNANFGILPELDIKVKDKKQRYTLLADRALQYITNFYKFT